MMPEKILEEYGFRENEQNSRAFRDLAWDADAKTTREAVYCCTGPLQPSPPYMGASWIALPHQAGWESVQPARSLRPNPWSDSSSDAEKLVHLIRMIHQVHSLYDSPILAHSAPLPYSGCCIPYIILWPQYRSPEGVVLYRILYAVQRYRYDSTCDQGKVYGLLHITAQKIHSSFRRAVYSSSEQRAFEFALWQTGWSFPGGILSLIWSAAYKELSLITYSVSIYCMRPVQVVCRELSPADEMSTYEVVLSFADVWRGYQQQYPSECLLSEIDH